MIYHTEYCRFKEDNYPKEKELTIDLCVSLNIFSVDNDIIIKEHTSNSLLSLGTVGVNKVCETIENIIIRKAFKDLSYSLHEYLENVFRIKKELETVTNSYKTDRILMIVHNYRSLVFIFNLNKRYCETLTLNSKGYHLSSISVDELDSEYRDFYILDKSPLKGKDIKNIKRILDMTIDTDELIDLINYIIDLKDDCDSDKKDTLWKGIDVMSELKWEIEDIVSQAKHIDNEET